MTAQRISEREWAKGAQAQAEEWYTSAIESAQARVEAAHEAWQAAQTEKRDLISRRAEMRESFARMWADA